jgi:TRAP-type C4-dicarboxylate transport system substrate-binding protein
LYTKEVVYWYSTGLFSFLKKFRRPEMKSRKLLLVGIILLASMSLAVPNVSAQSASSQKVVLRLSSSSPAAMDDSKALVEVAEFLKKKSGGSIVLQPYFSSSLFDEVAGMGAVQNGLVDMAIACTCNLTKQTSAFLFADLPYMFKTMDNGRLVWDGAIGKKARAQLQSATGLIAVGFAPSGGGYRILWNNRRQIKIPADMKGIKIRTTATPIEQEFWKLAGAIPTPIDVAEIYSAMQQGVVDGQHIQPMWAQLLKHDEVTKFGTAIDALAVYRVLVINPKSLAKLDAGQKNVFFEGMKLFEDRAYQNNRDGKAASLKAISAKGVQIYTPTENEMTQWKKLGEDFRKTDIVKRTVPLDIIDSAVAAQQ